MKNTLLLLFACLLTVTGLLGVTHEGRNIVEDNFPQHYASMVLDHALVFLITGLFLIVIKIILLARKQHLITKQKYERMLQEIDWLDRIGFTAKDKVAKKIGWAPLVAGGSNFTTHKLIDTKNGRIVITPTWKIKALAVIFGITGLYVGTFFNLERPLFHTIILTGGALGFLGTGLLIFYFYGRTAVFDQHLGWFWKAHFALNPNSTTKLNKLKNATELSKIYAVQVLSETVSSRGKNYNTVFNSYEINLVLKNGQRLNVIDHRNYATIQKNTDAIAKLLGVKLWNVVSGEFSD